MKAELEIPDDLALELERHARKNGRPTGEHVVSLIRLAMLVEALPLAEIGRLAGTLRALADARNRAVHQAGPPPMRTDPVTGLPVIISPPGAPIHAMSVSDALALEQSILEEQELQRADIPL